MNDDLDTLDDAKLSEVFAVEVAGWKPEHFDFEYDGSVKACCIYHQEDGSTIGSDRAPNFAADANAVLPYLRDYSLMERPEREYFLLKFPLCKEQGWVCELQCDHHDGGYCMQISTAKTPARACCLALIRAKRASK